MKRLLQAAALGLVLFLGLALLGYFLLRQPRVQDFVVRELAEATGCTVRYDRLQLSLQTGVGFSLEGFEARAAQGPEKIKAARVFVRLRAWDLLRKRIRPTRIHLLRPRLEIPWPEAAPGEADTQSLIRLPSLKWLARLRDLKLEQGEVAFTDRPYALTRLDLRVRRRRAKPLTLETTGGGLFNALQEEVAFKLAGTLTQDFGKEAGPDLNVALELKRFPLRWIPWPEFLDLRAGRMDMQVTVKSRAEEQLSLEGRAQIKDMDLAWVRRGRKPFPFSDWSMDFRALVRGRLLQVPSLQMRLPQAALSVAFNLDLKDGRNPYIESRLSAPRMSLKHFTDLFPSPMLPAWYEEDLFPLFRSGRIGVAELNMRGHTAAGSPDRYPDTPGLIVKMDCEDLEAQMPGAALPFEGVGARVEIENKTLRITDVKAGFGKSVMRQSGLESRTIFEDAPSFDITLAGAFDAPELAGQLNMDMLQPQIPARLKETTAAISNGTLNGRADLRYSVGKPPELRQGEFEFQDLRLNPAKYLLPIEIRTAQVKIAEGQEDRFEVSGSWGRSAVEARGTFEISGQQAVLQALHLDTRVDLNEILPLVLPAAEKWKFGEAVALQAELQRNDKSWSAHGNLDLSRFSAETAKWRAAAKARYLMFDLDLTPGRSLDVKQLLFTAREGQAEETETAERILRVGNAGLLKGSYDLRRKRLKAARLQISALRLESLGFFSREGKPIKGTLDCSLQFKSKEGKAAERLDGWAKGQDLEVHAGALPLPITDGQFFWRFNGSEVAIALCDLRLGADQVRINGGLTRGPTWKGHLLLEADELNLNDFKSSGPSTRGFSPNWKQWLGKTDFDLRVEIAQGLWRHIQWGPVSADLHLSGRGILIRQAELGTEHARLEGNGKILFHEKTGNPDMTFSGKLRLRDQPVQDILPLIGMDPKAVYGKLSLNGLFYAHGGDAAGLIKGLTGFAEMEMKDTVVQHSSALISILDFFSVKKIFKKRPPDVSKEGLYFDDIGAQVTVDQGLIKTEYLYLKGPVINVAVPNGRIDLLQKTVSMRLLVQPLQVVDSIVSHIPILGYILAGDDKMLIAYQFVMEGPWGKAQPKHEPIKDLDQNLIGFIKRIFMTPGRLLNHISNGLKKPSHGAPATSKDD